ncbi:hypothetical protein GOODEAATRI_016205 [Goodea atripinnis]|uniref:NADP-dependent oxidoreductase domain-containing protein n=1 Tax=Goodea atripinnis TaxID=208336 RepID=A0ABV0N1Y6_9TELE
MLWIVRGGFCTVRRANNIKTILIHLPRLESCRNMSSSPVKRPVTLLGTMAFGGRADSEQSQGMVTAFLNKGHNQLDTAFMYMDGRSEAIVGDMHLPKTGNVQRYNKTGGNRTATLPEILWNEVLCIQSSRRWSPDREVSLRGQGRFSACWAILWQQLGCSIQRQVKDQELVPCCCMLMVCFGLHRLSLSFPSVRASARNVLGSFYAHNRRLSESFLLNCGSYRPHPTAHRDSAIITKSVGGKQTASLWEVLSLTPSSA